MSTPKERKKIRAVAEKFGRPDYPMTANICAEYCIELLDELEAAESYKAIAMQRDTLANDLAAALTVVIKAVEVDCLTGIKDSECDCQPHLQSRFAIDAARALLAAEVERTKALG